MTRTATVSGTGGGATFIADGPLETCTQIDVAAQADTDGSWTFGWSGVGPWTDGSGADGPNRLRRWIVKATDTNNIHIANAQGDQDTAPMQAGDHHIMYAARIYADTAAAENAKLAEKWRKDTAELRDAQRVEILAVLDRQSDLLLGTTRALDAAFASRRSPEDDDEDPSP